MTGVKVIKTYNHGCIGDRGRVTSRVVMSGMDGELSGRTRYTRKREQKKRAEEKHRIHLPMHVQLIPQEQRRSKTYVAQNKYQNQEKSSERSV